MDVNIMFVSVKEIAKNGTFRIEWLEIIVLMEESPVHI